MFRRCQLLGHNERIVEYICTNQQCKQQSRYLCSFCVILKEHEKDPNYQTYNIKGEDDLISLYKAHINQIKSYVNNLTYSSIGVVKYILKNMIQIVNSLEQMLSVIITENKVMMNKVRQIEQSLKENIFINQEYVLEILNNNLESQQEKIISQQKQQIQVIQTICQKQINLNQFNTKQLINNSSIITQEDLIKLLKNKHYSSILQYLNNNPIQMTTKEYLEFSSDYHQNGLELVKQGKYNQARDIVTIATLINPEQPMYQVTLADIYKRKKFYYKAINLYEQVTKKKINQIILVKQAQCLIKVNKLYEAQQLLDQTIQMDNKYDQVYNQYAKYFIQINKFDKALECIKVAQKLKPSFFKYMIQECHIQIKLNRKEIAVKLFFALSNEKNSPYEYRKLANILIEMYQYEDALNLINKGLNSEPYDCRLWLLKAKTYRLLGQLDEFTHHYKIALQQNKKQDIFILINISKELQEVNQFKEAIIVLESGLQLEHDNPWICLELGKVHRIMKDYKSAEEFLDKASKNCKNDSHIYKLIGDQINSMARFKDSLNLYDMAIKFDRKCTPAYIAKGQLYGQQNEIDKAQNVLQQALQINDRDHITYQLVGDQYTFIGMYTDAIEQYDRALELDQDNPLYLISMGSSLRRSKNFDEADNKFKQAIQINMINKSPLIYQQLGNQYYNMQRYNDAIALYDKAINIEPQNITTYLLKGKCLFDQDNLSEAHILYDRVIEMNPKDSQSYFWKAKIFKKQGKIKESQDFYQEGIKIDPQHKDIYV
ncbi:hypothetical protein pb186bvf_012093 [Paramecium bursaria]